MKNWPLPDRVITLSAKMRALYESEMGPIDDSQACALLMGLAVGFAQQHGKTRAEIAALLELFLSGAFDPLQ